MKPAPFEYHRPASVEEALELLAEHGPDAKPLAGGQSLVPAMNFRLARPAVLVDLNPVAELDYLDAGDGVLRIGAMARQRAAERSTDVARMAPLLTETLPFVAHPQIRNRGTLGGSLAHADPAGEIAAVMLALDATVVLRGRSGERRVGVDGFFTGLFETALEPGELLVEIDVPALDARTGCAFTEVARRHGDYALAGVAAVVVLDDQGRCRRTRVSLLGVGEGPVLARRAMKALEGERPGAKVIAAAAGAAAAKDIDPPGDIHASAAYRRHLTGVLVRRALERACARAAGEPEPSATEKP